MVTGEPGSGKTSLGLALSAALRVPFLSRDHVRGGMLATAGVWTGRLAEDAPSRESAVDAFVAVVEAASAAGITLVIEFVVTSERRPAMQRLSAAAECLVVHTVAADAAARAERRDRRDPFFNRPEVLAALGHTAVDGVLAGPERARIAAELQVDFDLPTLRVRTDDGYAPPLDDIVGWVVDRTRSASRGV